MLGFVPNLFDLYCIPLASPVTHENEDSGLCAPQSRARSGPYTVFLLSQVDQMFSAWFHLYSIVCPNTSFAIIPVVTSEPHGLFQPGSPGRGCISMGFVAGILWAEEWEPCGCPSKGPRGCCEPLQVLPVNPSRVSIGIPSLPRAQLQEAWTGRGKVYLPECKGQNGIPEKSSALTSFKLLAKHNALPRKACLLLT